MKIVSARVTKAGGMFDPLPEVFVTLEDGVEQRLFDFYPDELSFSAREFVGLTLAEAHDLKRKKDVAFLRS